MQPLALVAVLGLAVAALSGCAEQPTAPKCNVAVAKVPDPEYLLVEYRTGGEYQKAPSVEVRPTPKYEEARSKMKAAAIRFPDSCLNSSASQASGVAQQTQTILQTTCGVYLSEMEKALSKSGFKVFSWDALYKLEKEKNVSTYNAGKQLGADVVFVFNSLEAGAVKGGSTVQTKYRFFESDERGTAKAAKPLDDNTRAEFKAAVQTLVGASRPNKDAILALASVIDATAVLTESGESVWFYRRATTLPVSHASGMKFLFGRMPAERWKILTPDVPAPTVNVVQAPRMSAEDNEETSDKAEVDEFRAQKLELIRTGAAEFVGAFQKGGKS